MPTKVETQIDETTLKTCSGIRYWILTTAMEEAMPRVELFEKSWYEGGGEEPNSLVNKIHFLHEVFYFWVAPLIIIVNIASTAEEHGRHNEPAE